MVVWLAEHAQRGRRPTDLALLAFADGQPLPEETVRAAFRSAADALTLPVEQSLDSNPGTSTPEAAADAIADLVAQAGLTGTMLPRRVRDIDNRLRATGLSWAPDAVARLDRRPRDHEPLTSKDLAVTALTMTRLGRQGVSNQEIGDVTRALLPADAASPFASMIEHLGEDMADVAVPDLGGAVPAGDVREKLRDLAADQPLELLRLAWSTVDAIQDWAETLCAEVDAELAAGQPGDAVRAWFLAAALGARMFLVKALRPGERTPTDQAQWTIELLLIRDMLRTVHAHAPDGHWERLEDPAVLPGCVRRLVDA